MSIITTYNNLNSHLYRGQIRQMIKQAKEEGVTEIVEKLTALLRNSPNDKEFHINVVNKISQASSVELNGLEFIEHTDNESLNGLEFIEHTDNEPLNGVEPDDIYQYITDLILDIIKKDGALKWDKPWLEKTDACRNYISDNEYRGINSLLLNFIYPFIKNKPWPSPYFLTFKQVDSLKGKIKKGAKGNRVIYFTQLYRFRSENENIDIGSYNKSKFIGMLKKSGASILKSISAEEIAFQSAIPILKYYNVFNYGDTEGISLKEIEGLKKKKFKPIEIAESIIQTMPNKPNISHSGNMAFYLQKRDVIQLPKPDFFKEDAKYYATAFHELIHSTGHKTRVNRSLKGKFGSKAYAFEELIAELGAAFLSSESGILNFHIKNTAAYIEGWAEKLTKNLKEDNRFFFRASSQAQKAVDYILDRDKEGIPKYQKGLKNESTRATQKVPKSQPKEKPKSVKETTKPKPKSKPKPKRQKVEQLALFGLDKKVFSLDGFERASEIPEKPSDVFVLPNSIGKFIQNIQAHQALILIKGTKHTSKSQLAMQLANAFAELGLNVAYLDYEQGGIESKDTQNSIMWNLKPKNASKVFIKGYVEHPMNELKAIAESANVLIADSVTDLGITADQLNYLRKTYPKVIWVFISQVKENGSMYGGNKMAHNPTAIIECHPSNDPKERYATLEKNRGNDLSICYDIFKQQAFIWKEVKKKEGDEEHIVTEREYFY